MIETSIIGFPYIGKNRELETVVEGFNETYR